MSIQLRNLTSCVALLAALAFSVVSAANAGSIACTGGASNVSFTLTTSTTATCGPFGNGGLNGNTDDINALGFTTLDTATPASLNSAGAFTTLTLTSLTSTTGHFSFNTPSGFSNFLLAIATTTGVPRPDYFAFFLPSGVNSGDFAINVTGTDSDPPTAFVRAIIYATPGPIAGAGLPGLILAGGGLLAWLRRRKGAQTVTA